MHIVQQKIFQKCQIGTYTSKGIAAMTNKKQAGIQCLLCGWTNGRWEIGFSNAVADLREGGAVYYASPQSFIITLSYSLC